MGTRGSSVVITLDCDQNVSGRVPTGAAEEISLPGSTFCGYSLFWDPIPAPLLPQQHIKDPGHSAKSAGGRLQPNTHAPYVSVFKQNDTVNWCMI